MPVGVWESLGLFSSIWGPKSHIFAGVETVGFKIDSVQNRPLGAKESMGELPLTLSDVFHPHSGEVGLQRCLLRVFRDILRCFDTGLGHFEPKKTSENLGS